MPVSGMHTGKEWAPAEHDAPATAEPLYLEPSMLPGDLADKLTAGDKITFKVVRKDDDGDFELQCCAVGDTDVDEGEGDDNEDGTSPADWESDFRSAMSPRNDDTPQAPEQ